MCGIAGIFAYHYASLAADRGELRRIRDYMAARGPDGLGEWYSEDGRVAFGHRRLSIIDLNERAAQPMLSNDGAIAVTFNGEIYNYEALRNTLESKGYIFRTKSDTEVLLNLYAEKGESFVRDLRGMFAFCIWDSRKRSLLLARDPYGIKPLYYADDGWTLRFASQVKALLAGGKVSRDPEPAGRVGFYLFGSVPEPFTIWQEIRSLPAGSTLWIDERGPSETRAYFSIAEIYKETEDSQRAKNTKAEFAQIAQEAFLDSIRHHLVADVPVGSFLSAGVDSGALVGLMRDAGQSEIRTVTLSFDEYKDTHDDETPLAEHTAKQFDTLHTVRRVTLEEFTNDLPLIMEAMDQPSIDGVNTWFVSKAARELGLKVAISGLGGDELLGGYPSFDEIPKWVRNFSFPSRVPILGRSVRWMLTRLIDRHLPVSPKAAGLLEYAGSYPGAYLLKRGLFMPWELNALLDNETLNEGMRRLEPLIYIGRSARPCLKSPWKKVAALEASLYMRNQLLRDTDWASMAHSLEVRVPLVDSHLLRRMAPIAGLNGHIGKKLLANSPSRPLPVAVTSRKKTGFNTPVAKWLMSDKRVQRWKSIPALAAERCPWARRWAYDVASTQF